MKKYKNHRLFTLNNPYSPRICPELAEEIGLNESIILLQLEFWMATEGAERDDGHIWLRKTVREIQEEFLFWGTGTVGRIVESLITKEFVVAADLDEGPGKSGRWLRFNFDRLTLLKSIRILSQSGTTVVPNNHDSVPTRDNRPYIDKDQEYIQTSGATHPKQARARRRPIIQPLDAGKEPLRRGYQLGGGALAQVSEQFPDVEIETARVAWMGSRISSGRGSVDWDADFVSYCAAIHLNREEKRGKRNGNGNGSGNPDDLYSSSKNLTEAQMQSMTHEEWLEWEASTVT